MDITTATPVEIDTILARIGGEIAKRHTVIDRATDTINLELRYPAPDGSINQRRIDQCQALIDTAGKEIEALIAERMPLDTEFFRRGSWARYFLVDSDTGSGHVHYDLSNSRCSRVPSTRHYWLTSESGKPASEVVEQAGAAVCTVCFPGAPVEVLCRPRGYHTPSEWEKQARAAEREAKAVARRAKEITNPDGTPLRLKDGRYFETVKTVRAAEVKLVDIQFWAKLHERGLTIQDIENLDTLVVALAAKQRKDEGTVRSDSTVRLIKKCQREQVRY